MAKISIPISVKDENLIKIATILRKIRKCDAPSIMREDTVPCAFCYWENDNDTIKNDESGCFWWAALILTELKT